MVDRMSFHDCHRIQIERDELLKVCVDLLRELEERNAEEGMALTLSEKAEWMTPGFRAMLAAVKKFR